LRDAASSSGSAGWPAWSPGVCQMCNDSSSSSSSRCRCRCTTNNKVLSRGFRPPPLRSRYRSPSGTRTAWRSEACRSGHGPGRGSTSRARPPRSWEARPRWAPPGRGGPVPCRTSSYPTTTTRRARARRRGPTRRRAGCRRPILPPILPRSARPRRVEVAQGGGSSGS